MSSRLLPGGAHKQDHGESSKDSLTGAGSHLAHKSDPGLDGGDEDSPSTHGPRGCEELRSRRDLLLHTNTVNEETLSILGLSGEAIKASTLHSSNEFQTLPPDPQTMWTQARVTMLRDMAGTTGKFPAEAEISSMGATSPPHVEAPSRISDWIVSDGAQVTRPSIDPYREEIRDLNSLERSINLSVWQPVLLHPPAKGVSSTDTQNLCENSNRYGTIVRSIWRR